MSLGQLTPSASQHSFFLQELWSKRSTKVNRAQLFAAEIFGYSFANYANHLSIGNVRYERLMPKDAETLEGIEYYEGYFDECATRLRK